MKKTILAALFISLGYGAFAQKFAHVDRQAIVFEMPQIKDVEKVLNDATKSFQEELSSMEAEYNNKVTEYESKSNLPVKDGGWPEAIKQSKGKALADHQQNIMDFRNTAQTELQKIEQDAYAPLLLAFDNAVKKIAKENNILYVFDTSTGALLFAGGEDISEKIRVELKIPAPSPTAPNQK
jgi:outer membrane protein